MTLWGPGLRASTLWPGKICVSYHAPHWLECFIACQTGTPFPFAWLCPLKSVVTKKLLLWFHLLQRKYKKPTLGQHDAIIITLFGRCKAHIRQGLISYPWGTYLLVSAHWARIILTKSPGTYCASQQTGEETEALVKQGACACMEAGIWIQG